MLEGEKNLQTSTYSLGSGSNNYVDPTEGELSIMFDIINKLKLWIVDEEAITDENTITSDADSINYEIFYFVDSSTSNTYFVLKEKTSSRKGWGLFIINTDPSSMTVLGVPHPHHDTNTWWLSAEVMDRLDAFAITMGGAHRNCSTTATPEFWLNNKYAGWNYKKSDMKSQHSNNV